MKQADKNKLIHLLASTFPAEAYAGPLLTEGVEPCDDDARDLIQVFQGRSWKDIKSEMYRTAVRVFGFSTFMHTHALCYYLPGLLMTVVELGTDADLVIDDVIDLLRDATIRGCLTNRQKEVVRVVAGKLVTIPGLEELYAEAMKL